MRFRRRTMSTRVRILAAILVVAAAGMTLAGGVTFAVQRERILSDVDDGLRDRSALLVPADDPTATTYLDPGVHTNVQQYLAAAEEESEAVPGEAVLSIVDGTVLPSPASTGFTRSLADNEAFIQRVTTAGSRSTTPVLDSVQTPAGTMRFFATPVKVPTDPATGMQVRVINLSAALAPVGSSALTYTLVALSSLIAMAVAGWFVLGRTLLSPIRSLQRTADAITLSDLHQRVPEGGNDDLSNVGRTVNEMLDRLEGSVDVQRRLLDDVRHELKTPITIVRGHLEMMNVDDRDDVASARDIGISELDRMTRLVEDIDLLAAVEDDEYTMGLVDISHLTTRVGDLVIAIPGHDWRVLDRSAVVVRGNPDRLLQAWLALADNAAKYTADGLSIELGSTLVGNSVHLWVRDHGPGIPAASRRRIFRRFDRGGGRRDVGGTGLGLAIVDAIARAHGGSCTVTDTPGGGATFVIRIPVTLGSNTAVFPAPVRAGDLIQQWEETG